MSSSPSAVKSATRQNATTAALGETAQLTLLALCFILSGGAALVYQTAWTRQFALIFGTSELAVATVLAAYMAGLAFGAWLIEKWLPRVTRPVLAYAVLELGIAVSAVALVPLLLAGSQMALLALFGNQPAPPSSDQVGTSLLYLIGAFVALAVPTTLMGATLPLLARHAVQDREQIGRRIGLLYASNTFGAVLGALGTAFVLLPNLGLTRTVWTGAALNGVVLLLAAALVRRERSAWTAAAHSRPAAPTAPVRFPFVAPPAAVWVLPLMMLSGAVSFAHEVLWARMLSHVVGSSIYAFGVMVGSFLAGIALGGAAGAWLARDRSSAGLWLAAAQLLAALWAAAAFLLLPGLIGAESGLYANAALAFLLLLPLTFAIGTTYPLAVRILADRAEEAAPASARVYAWNTLGAIAGSLAAGFFLIPWLRYEGTIRVTAAASAILAVLILLLLERRKAVLTGGVAAAVLIGILAFRPGMPERLLLASPLNVANTGHILYYDVGRSASVVMLQQDGGLALRTNGLPEALMDSPGMAARFSGEFWMSSLAAILRPETRSMLVVGYGGGVVVEGVPPSVERVDVIELEPKVIEANRETARLRKFDPLGDPRVTIITNDARGALSLTNKRYGAIVSQPSHPWTAGASHLYTREFMQLARDHMEPGGVFVQWMNVAFVDEAILRSLAATLIDVFGRARVYRPDPNTLVFVASSDSLAIENRLLDTGVPVSLTPRHYARFGINAAEDLVAALAADESGTAALAAGAALITDDTNRMATSSVYELGRGLSADAAGRLLAPYDPLQRPDSFIYRELRGGLDFTYLARRMNFYRALDGSIVDRIRRMGEALGPTDAGGYAQLVLLAGAGERERSAAFGRELAARFPASAPLQFALLQPSQAAIARGEVSADVARSIASMPPSAQASFRGSQLLLKRDFTALADLDAILASARWTDPWFSDATLLRAEWRVRVSNPGLARTLADEAIGLLDRLAVVQPSLPVHVLRARAAISADRPEILVESVWQVAQWTSATTRDSADARSRARDTLNELLQLLSGRESDPRINARRLSEVRDSIQTAIARLNT